MATELRGSGANPFSGELALGASGAAALAVPRLITTTCGMILD